MKKFTGFLLFGLLLLTLGFGTLTLQSAQNALSIWFEKLVPSMFLSMVLVRLLYKEHAFDHLPSLGLPALLGMDQGGMESGFMHDVPWLSHRLCLCG